MRNNFRKKFLPSTHYCLTTMTRHFILGYWPFFDQCVPLQGCDQVVDTTALVRSCVQSAVGMLRDQVESGFRSTQRVEILLTLLSDNDELKGTNNLILVFYFCLRWFHCSWCYLTLFRWISANCEEASSLIAVDSWWQRLLVHQKQLGH